MSKTLTPYLQFLKAFQELAMATAAMEKINLTVNAEQRAAVNRRATRYLALAAGTQLLEEQLQEWAKAHPEWFGGKKTLTTPHGTISKRESCSLEIPDEFVTMKALAEGRIPGAAMRGLFTEPDLAAFLESVKHALFGDLAPYLRIELELDREALEKLPDAELKEYHVTRKKTEAMTVKPLAVDMGKAAAKAAAAGEETKEGK